MENFDARGEFLPQSQIDLLNSVTHDYKPPLSDIYNNLNKLKGHPLEEDAKRLQDLIDVSLFHIKSDGSFEYRSPGLSKIRDAKLQTRLIAKKAKALPNPQLQKIFKDGRFNSYEEAVDYIEVSISKLEEELPIFINKLNERGAFNFERILKLAPEALDSLRNAWDFFEFSNLKQEEIDTKKRKLRMVEDIMRTMGSIRESESSEVTKKDADLEVQTHVNPTELSIMSHPILRKVIYNLVINGIKYGETIVTVNATQEGSNTLIVVSDDGRGIPKDEQQHIFKARFQGANALKSTGLGLWMCREIVEKLGGIIGVDSEPRGGAAFYVLLPTSGDSKLSDLDLTEELKTKINGYRRELTELPEEEIE